VSFTPAGGGSVTGILVYTGLVGVAGFLHSRGLGGSELSLSLLSRWPHAFRSATAKWPENRCDVR
jgi:hypothetical protein